MTNLNELSDEIIRGKRLERDDDLSFFKNCDVRELTAATAAAEGVD